MKRGMIVGKITDRKSKRSPQERYRAIYNGARINLLVAMLLTVLNCVLALTGADVYYLFSIAFPYAMVFDGAMSCGLVYSLDEYRSLYEDMAMDFLPMTYLYVMLAIAGVSLLVYLLCWIFSKKHVGWLVAATVLLVLDSAFLVFWYEVDLSMLLDYLFHAWVLIIFVRGLWAHSRLKHLKKRQLDKRAIQ